MHHIDADPDPDPAFSVGADPNPIFFNAAPDPTFSVDANPDPTFYVDVDLADADLDLAFFLSRSGFGSGSTTLVHTSNFFII
jgi:hypothetical protein